jgi:hypothetical protein
VMMRGTFANIRIKNQMVKDETGAVVEGGFTIMQPRASACRFMTRRCATWPRRSRTCAGARLGVPWIWFRRFVVAAPVSRQVALLKMAKSWLKMAKSCAFIGRPWPAAGAVHRLT